jgi:5'-3' exonuclease
VARVRALASGQPHVAVCCEGGRSFRKDLSPDYKANRPEHDAALQHQIALAIETLKGDGFPVWSAKGYEADDIIATATANVIDHLKVAGATSIDTVTIASADKDLLQLIGPRVTVHSLTSGNVVDEDAVQLKLGVSPSQVIDYLSLVGDTSDNVKGANGIGPKKAADLLKKYGNLEDLYTELTAHGTAFTPAIATALREFQPRMALVRELITLKADAPIPFEEIFKERVPIDVAVFGDEPANDDAGRASDIEDSMPTLLEVQQEAESFHALMHRASAPEPNGMGVKVAPSQPLQSVLDPVGPTAPAFPPFTPPGPFQTPAPARQDATATGSTSGAPASPQPATQALAVREPEGQAPVEWERQLEPRSMTGAKQLAADLFASRLFSAYGNPPAVLSTILAGRELGLQAMASLRAFHIIDGKPALAADLIRALVLKSGAVEYFRCTERTAERATFVIKRKGEPEVPLTYTIDEGKAAWAKDEKAWKASGWGRNPADMLVARASAKLARLVCPDVTHGLYAPEELD